MSRNRRVPALAVVLGLGVGSALPLSALPLSAQRTWSRSSCDTCDVQGQGTADRDLARAQRDLDRAIETLREKRDALNASADTTGELREAYVKAQGEVRRASERYDALLSQLMRRDLARAQSANERAAARMMEKLRKLQETPRMPQGWLGVTLSMPGRSDRDSGKTLMRFDDYPTIETVEPGSPAEQAGIEAGDRVIALNGHSVLNGTEPFTVLLKPGARLPMRVKRGRYTKDLTVIVGKRPQNEWSDWAYSFKMPPMPPVASEPPQVQIVTPMPPVPPMPPMSYSFRVDPNGIVEMRSPESGMIAGAQVQRATGDLKDYFGVSDGLVVLSVIPGTPAARAGLHGGDVIIRADSHGVTTPLVLSSIMDQATNREVKLDIVRKKRKQVIVLSWDQP